MYTDTEDSYGYCSGGNKEEIEQLLKAGVDAATDLDLYAVIDWHILGDGNQIPILRKQKISLSGHQSSMPTMEMSYMRLQMSQMAARHGKT